MDSQSISRAVACGAAGATGFIIGLVLVAWLNWSSDVTVRDIHRQCDKLGAFIGKGDRIYTCNGRDKQ